MPRISIIVCIAQNGAIGYQGGLLYHLRADLKQFKSLTTGHTVLMGRRTFQSLPKGALPNRRNIVLTRQDGLQFPGAEVFPSLQAALAHCTSDEEVFIIGGSSVYREALPLAETLYLTRVDDIPEKADTFFPSIDLSEWTETEKASHPQDEQNEKPFEFVTLTRKH